jgi:hypothetical protein
MGPNGVEGFPFAMSVEAAIKAAHVGGESEPDSGIGPGIVALTGGGPELGRKTEARGGVLKILVGCTGHVS